MKSKKLNWMLELQILGTVNAPATASVRRGGGGGGSLRGKKKNGMRGKSPILKSAFCLYSLMVKEYSLKENVHKHKWPKWSFS